MPEPTSSLSVPPAELFQKVADALHDPRAIAVIHEQMGESVFVGLCERVTMLANVLGLELKRETPAEAARRGFHGKK